MDGEEGAADEDEEEEEDQPKRKRRRRRRKRVIVPVSSEALLRDTSSVPADMTGSSVNDQLPSCPRCPTRVLAHATA